MGVVMSMFLCRSGRSCYLACVFSTPWCKRGVNLVRLVGTYRTVSMSPTYESASGNCRFVLLLKKVIHMLYLVVKGAMSWGQEYLFHTRNVYRTLRGSEFSKKESAII